MANILVVEDDKDNQEVISTMLQLAGHSVTLASDGQKAMDLLDDLKPELILLDMSMPVMDGWTTAQLIKSKTEYEHIPIVAVTAHAMAGDEKRMRAAGCDGYLTKPIDYFELTKTVDEFLRPKNA